MATFPHLEVVQAVVDVDIWVVLRFGTFHKHRHKSRLLTCQQICVFYVRIIQNPAIEMHSLVRLHYEPGIQTFIWKNDNYFKMRSGC